MSNQQLIPLSVPNIAGNEWKYVKDCLDTGWISSVGAYVTQFEQMVAAICRSQTWSSNGKRNSRFTYLSLLVRSKAW